MQGIYSIHTTTYIHTSYTRHIPEANVLLCKCFYCFIIYKPLLIIYLNLLLNYIHCYIIISIPKLDNGLNECFYTIENKKSSLQIFTLVKNQLPIFYILYLFWLTLLRLTCFLPFYIDNNNNSNMYLLYINSLWKYITITSIIINRKNEFYSNSIPYELLYCVAISLFTIRLTSITFVQDISLAPIYLSQVGIVPLRVVMSPTLQFILFVIQRAVIVICNLYNTHIFWLCTIKQNFVYSHKYFVMTQHPKLFLYLFLSLISINCYQVNKKQVDVYHETLWSIWVFKFGSFNKLVNYHIILYMIFYLIIHNNNRA